MGRSAGGGRSLVWLGGWLLAVGAARVAVPNALRRAEDLLLVVPGQVLGQVLRLWQPGTVSAAPRSAADPNAQLCAALLRRLRDAAQPPEPLRPRSVMAQVREVRAPLAPAGLRPDQLVLDLTGGQGGEPVLCGDVLLGFLAAPRPEAPAVVELLAFAPPPGSGAPHRLLAVATVEDPAVTAPETLRFVVEPSGPHDPFPLHVVKPDRPHVNTWRDGVEFLARTLPLPPVPGGLRLGRVRTRGYLAPDFVLDWYLEPELDVRALHTVAVLQAEGPLQPVATLERVPVAALGRFTLPGGRELLLVAGADLTPGCAVVAGERLLGQVVSRAGPVATVRPFGDPGAEWPVVLWEESQPGPCELLLEPLACRDGLVRCRVRRARLDRVAVGDPARPPGVLFTGAVAPATPVGLVLGECRWLAPDELEVATPSARLPRELHAVRVRAAMPPGGR